MKKDKRRKDKVKEEKRPPLETNGMGFNEVLKRLAQTKPFEVDELQQIENPQSTNPQK